MRFFINWLLVPLLLSILMAIWLSEAAISFELPGHTTVSQTTNPQGCQLKGQLRAPDVYSKENSTNVIGNLKAPGTKTKVEVDCIDKNNNPQGKRAVRVWVSVKDFEK